MDTNSSVASGSRQTPNFLSIRTNSKSLRKSQNERKFFLLFLIASKMGTSSNECVFWTSSNHRVYFSCGLLAVILSYRKSEATNADVHAMGMVGMEVRWFSHHLLSNRCINHRTGGDGRTSHTGRKKADVTVWDDVKKDDDDERVWALLIGWLAFYFGGVMDTGILAWPHFGEIGLLERCEMWLYHHLPFYLLMYQLSTYLCTFFVPVCGGVSVYTRAFKCLRE